MGKQYDNLQKMLEDIDPEFAEHYRKHRKRLRVRLRMWWVFFVFKLKLRWSRMFWKERVDYQALLEKYVRMIYECEGITGISKSLVENGFTKEEVRALLKIDLRV